LLNLVTAPKKVRFNNAELFRLFFRLSCDRNQNGANGDLRFLAEVAMRCEMAIIEFTATPSMAAINGA
jgi:hypothetical protein